MEDRTLGDECGFELEGDKRFAMEKNPLRFLPCFDQRCDCDPADEGWGSCKHCIFHRIHNATKSFFVSLNLGFMEQIISVTKYLKCSYYFAHLKSAIDLLLGLLPADELAAVDGEDPFYRECREAIT